MAENLWIQNGGSYLPEKKGVFDIACNENVAIAMKTWTIIFGFNTNTLG